MWVLCWSLSCPASPLKTAVGSINSQKHQTPLARTRHCIITSRLLLLPTIIRRTGFLRRYRQRRNRQAVTLRRALGIVLINLYTDANIQTPIIVATVLAILRGPVARPA